MDFARAVALAAGDSAVGFDLSRPFAARTGKFAFAFAVRTEVLNLFDRVRLIEDLVAHPFEDIAPAERQTEEEKEAENHQKTSGHDDQFAGKGSIRRNYNLFTGCN